MAILTLDEVDSTNTYAKNHFDDLADGTLVYARRQTAGRGRLNRVWYSAEGQSLTASFVMKNIPDGFIAGCVGGLAALALVRECCPGAVSYLKWPNDVYIGCAKVAGILCEGIIRHNRLEGVICGIGINVNTPESVLSSIDQPAAGLKTASGGKSDFFIDNLAERLEKIVSECYISFNLDFFTLRKNHIRENRLIGQMIQMFSPDGKRFCGVFSGIGDGGELLLDIPGEGTRVFNCGDVKLDAASFDCEKIRRSLEADGYIK